MKKFAELIQEDHSYLYDVKVTYAFGDTPKLYSRTVSVRSKTSTEAKSKAEQRVKKSSKTPIRIQASVVKTVIKSSK